MTSNNTELAAKNMSKIAKAISVSAKDAAESTARFGEIMYNYWDNIMRRFPKLNISVCAKCGNRRLFDLQGTKDHPCPLYNRTFMCSVRHILRRIKK